MPCANGGQTIWTDWLCSRHAASDQTLNRAEIYKKTQHCNSVIYRNVYFPVNYAVILYWLYFIRKRLILQDFSKENFHQRYLTEKYTLLQESGLQWEPGSFYEIFSITESWGGRWDGSQGRGIGREGPADGKKAYISMRQTGAGLCT